MLLIELISISNMGVSLIEMCFCSRLYGIYNLLAVTLPQDEIELQPLKNEHDCDNENLAMKESVATKTSIWQRHRCLIISIITVMVISSIAVSLAIVLVPRTPGMS